MGKMWNWILQNLKRGFVLAVITTIVDILLGILAAFMAAIISGGNVANGVAWLGTLLIIATPFIWVLNGWLIGLIVKRIK